MAGIMVNRPTKIISGLIESKRIEEALRNEIVGLWELYEMQKKVKMGRESPKNLAKAHGNEGGRK